MKKNTRIALINDYAEGTGIGNYAFSLLGELKKLIDIELIQLEKGFPFPLMKKTLNNYLYFPGRIPRNYEIFHLSNQFLSRIAQRNKPSVITCMDVIPRALKEDYPKALVFLLDKCMKKMSEAESIIVPSEFTKREIKKYYGIGEEVIKVIPLGYNKKVFKPMKKSIARKKLRINKDKKIILNVGSEEPRKNIPLLIDAFDELREQEKKVELIRVGEERKETRKLIEKKRLTKVIAYYNNVPEEKLALLYNSADVFVFPSTYEGFGLPLLEAMACNTPIITTSETSIPEVVGKSALFLEEKNSIELRELIKEVLNNNKLREKIVRQGKKQVKGFSWEKCAKKTIETYKEVL
ncbi:MAG: glycosyltransferase family 1 protein [archaeon]